MDQSHVSFAQGRPRLALPLSPDFNPWEDSHLVDMILYIGNLSPETSYQELYYYLLNFDEVVWLKIQFDRPTAAPKGYAHAILKTSFGYHRILTTAVHLLRGYKLRIKMGRKSMCFATVEEEVNKRKVFVKRLPKNMTIDRLKSYFSSFGSVVDVDIPLNHVDKTSRRIGFVTFESEEIAIKCAEIKKHRIKGAEIICKRYGRPEDKAVEPEKTSKDCLQSGKVLGSGSTAPLEKVSEWNEEDDHRRSSLIQEDIEIKYPAIHPKHLVFLQSHFPFHGAGQNQSTFSKIPAFEPLVTSKQTFAQAQFSRMGSLDPTKTLCSRAAGQKLLSNQAPPSEQLYNLNQDSLRSAGFKPFEAFGDGSKRTATEFSKPQKPGHRTGTAMVFLKDFGLMMVKQNKHPEL